MIYQIEPYAEVYVGKTTMKLEERKSKHVSDCYIGCNYPIYQYIRANGGFDANFKFKVLEQNQCTALQAKKIELNYIDIIKPTCNKNKPAEIDTDGDITQWKSEYYQSNKEKMKEYRQANKEKIKEQKKERYQANKEKIKEQMKEYRQANKEKIKEHRRQRYLKQKQQKVDSSESTST
jgi:hypothetical protein